VLPQPSDEAADQDPRDKKLKSKRRGGMQPQPAEEAAEQEGSARQLKGALQLLINPIWIGLTPLTPSG